MSHRRRRPKSPRGAQRSPSPFIEHHFSLWEAAHFWEMEAQMKEDEHIDRLLDQLFPT